MSQSEYLVRVEFVAEQFGEEGVDALRRAEAVRALELAEAGNLVRLWRPSGPGWANIGLWRADSEDHLQEMLCSLPLHPYMKVSIELLTEHPSDPAATGPHGRTDSCETPEPAP